MRGVKLNIGGVERTLRYDLNALAELGDRLGVRVRLSSISADLMETQLPISALRTVLWAGLIHAEPELDEKTVGSWVDAENAGEVLHAFLGLFGAHLSEDARSAVAAKLGVESPAVGVTRTEAA